MEALIFAPLSWFYRFLVFVDKFFSIKHDLRYPVVSVGNIAMGGRAKTPFVIYLCRKLKSAGYEPVVLTRGYGRKVKEPVRWTLGEADDVSRMGDEAVEIARSGAASAILVGSRRAENAFGFLHAQTSPKRWVFVLDDGFQHWGIRRDVDIVLVTEDDLSNRVLPWGELREDVKNLSRASHVLQLGKDLSKDTEVMAADTALQKPLILTTRANHRAYHFEMKKRFLGAESVALRDHAPREAIVKAIQDFAGSTVILGDKEAVKLFDATEHQTWLSQGKISKRFGPHEKKIYRASLRLMWHNEHGILQNILEKLRTKMEQLSS